MPYLHIIFPKRVPHFVALLRYMTCKLRHPMTLRHPVHPTHLNLCVYKQSWHSLTQHLCLSTCVCLYVHIYVCVYIFDIYTPHTNTPQHTATHCNTLQHTATHCNTLQHTATHCNTLTTHLPKIAHISGRARSHPLNMLKCVAVCCSVLQCVFTAFVSTLFTPSEDSASSHRRSAPQK